MCHYIETICIKNGQICNLTAHNNRLNATRMAMYGEVDLINLVNFIAPASYQLRTKCRVEYGCEIIGVEYALYTLRSITSLHLVTCNNIDYIYKSTDRGKLNKLFNLRGEADDILIVKNNRLTDTSICNIALWNGSAWETPMYPLLKGTRRSQLIQERIVTERDIFLEELQEYTRIRLFNAMIEFGEIEMNLANCILK